MFNISASIVAFKNDRDVLKKAIASFLNGNLQLRLYVVDNSPTDTLKEVCAHQNVEYIFNRKNLGFGAGHNLALAKVLDTSKYHLILNPDVYFGSGVLEKLSNFMDENNDVGLLMPKVLYPDGALQHLCRLLPTPLDLLLRKFDNKALSFWINLMSKYELKFANYARQMEVPYLSGCFMFIRTQALKQAGVFDERFFIYFEDVDLSRRIHRWYRTVYYPEVSIYHGYARGSNKDAVLLKHLMHSGVKYFNKWGWFFDQERKSINKQALKSLHSNR